MLMQVISQKNQVSPVLLLPPQAGVKGKLGRLLGVFEVSSHASLRTLSTHIIGTDKDYVMQDVRTSIEGKRVISFMFLHL